MAGCEPLVRALLLADPAVSAAVGGSRIYPLDPPAGLRAPGDHVSARVAYPDRSRSAWEEQVQNARLQMDCWAATYGEVKELAADVLNVLGGYVVMAPGPPPTLRAIAALPDERDLYESEPAPPVYRVSADYRCWWHEE